MICCYTLCTIINAFTSASTSAFTFVFMHDFTSASTSASTSVFMHASTSASTSISYFSTKLKHY
jgi:hypothetical protein